MLEDIRSQTGINFIYSDKLVDDLKVSFKIEGVSAKSAINKILNRLNISFRVFNKNSYVLFKKNKPEESHYRAVVIREDIPNVDTTHVVIEPRIISRLEPVYPLLAIAKEIEGNVTVNLFVTKEGDVLKAVVKSSSGSGILDSAAVEYSYKLKFLPAQDNDKPRSMWVSMLYRYFFSK